MKEDNIALNITINGDAGRKEIIKLEESMYDAKVAVQALKDERLALATQGKKDSPEYAKLTAEIDKQSIALKEQKGKYAELLRQQDLTKLSLKELKSLAGTTRIAFNNATPGTAAHKKLRTELNALNNQMKVLKGTAQETGGVLKRSFNFINSKIGGLMAAAASLFVVTSALERANEKFRELDEAQVDAQKTTGLTATGVDDLSDSLSKIDTRTTQNELLAISRIAGKLGVQGKKDIEEFTDSADKITVALKEDLGGNVEEVITQVGKLNDIFGLNEQYGYGQSMLKTASTLNELGMASTAAEGYLVEFAKRVAGTAPNVDISIQSVLGLGATLDKLGQTSEVAGTTYGQMISAMYKRTETFAKIAKMEISEFKTLMEKDMNEAFIRVLEGMKGGGMDLIVKSLAGMKLEGQRAQQVIGVLVDNTDELRRQQGIANKAFTEGTSIMNEFNLKNNSATAIYEKHKKAMTEQATILGEVLNPAIEASNSVKLTSLKILTSLIKWLYDARKVILISTFAILGYRAGVLLAAKGQVIWTGVVKLFTTATRLGTLAMTAFSAASKMSGIGIIVAIIGAAAAAMFAFRDRIFRTTQSLKNFSAELTVTLDSEKRKLEELEEAATSATIGSNQRAAAIKLINENYKDYLPNLLTEKSSNEDITSALRTVNTELEKNIRLKLRRQETEDLIASEMNATKEVINNLTSDIASWSDLADLSAEKQQLIAAAVMDYVENIRLANGEAKTNSEETLKLYSDLKDLGLSKKATSLDMNPEVTIKSHLRYTVAPLVDAVNNKIKSVAKFDAIYGKVDALSPEPSGGLIVDDDPANPNTDNDVGEWSLSSDEAYLHKRQDLKQKYLKGEILTETEFSDELLKLEIQTLRDRLAITDKDSKDQIKLQSDLDDKLLDQKKRAQKAKDDVTKIEQSAETDPIKIAQNSYEWEKKENAGNAKALEALEKVHLRNLTQIRLDAVDEKIKEDQELYELNKGVKADEHKQELLYFEGTASERRELRQRQMQEMKEDEEKHLTDLASQLKSLIDTGLFDGIQINTKLLSPEEVKELEMMLEKVKILLGNAQEPMEDIDDMPFKGRDIDILGMSTEDWDRFFKNLEDGELGIKDIALAIADSLVSAFSMYHQVVSAFEDRELYEFKKNNADKKRDLDRRLDAGLISQDAYNAQTEQMDAEYDAKAAEIQIKQAKRQKAISISEAIINTAIGVTKALTILPPFGQILAALIGVQGAAQIALISATPIETSGAEEGGIVAERMQDGKRFNANYSPNKRGYINSPTVLVSENGQEYVIPADGMNNPTLSPFIGAIEKARKSGSLGSFNFDAVYRQPTVALGYSQGGRVGSKSSSTPTEHTWIVDNDTFEMLTTISKHLEDLNKKADNPIPAIAQIGGSHGIKKALDKYDKLQNKGNLGGA